MPPLYAISFLQKMTSTRGRAGEAEVLSHQFGISPKNGVLKDQKIKIAGILKNVNVIEIGVDYTMK